jgi:hypothetical protein
MNPTLLVLLPFLAPSRSTQKLKELTSRMLPAMLPGPPGQRLAVAALVADQQIKRQERQQVEIAKEVVQAGKIKDIDALKEKLPKLAAIVTGLAPSAQAEILKAVPASTPRNV